MTDTFANGTVLVCVCFETCSAIMSTAVCVSCGGKDEKIEELEKLLNNKEKEINSLKLKLKKYEEMNLSSYQNNQRRSSDLASAEISRYGRQLIMPQLGMEGQKKLKACSVLIVGAGGLGCPVGLYLTAGGIGTIGIVDYDSVEINNLHRQVLHSEDNVGTSKCKSFVQFLRRLNSRTNFVVHETLLNSKNALQVMQSYDIIVDASDNAPTRYLLNDAACILGKPLVSGSALRFEGQLTVYNIGECPCYRCLYPCPPNSSTVTNCSEGGVLGPVTGVIGCLQALEVMKIIIGLDSSFKNQLLHFDGESGKFRTFKLRGKNPNCVSCGPKKMVELIDYEVFCNLHATDKEPGIAVLDSTERVSCKEYKAVLDNEVPHILIDVRPNTEMQICSLPGSVNIPLKELLSEFNRDVFYSKVGKSEQIKTNYIICRRGNDSQIAVKFLKAQISDVVCYDIIGGLQAWHNEIDVNFPLY